MKVAVISVTVRQDGLCDVVVTRERGVQETYIVKNTEALYQELYRARASDTDRASLQALAGTTIDL